MSNRPKRGDFTYRIPNYVRHLPLAEVEGERKARLRKLSARLANRTPNKGDHRSDNRSGSLS